MRYFHWSIKMIWVVNNVATLRLRDWKRSISRMHCPRTGQRYTQNWSYSLMARQREIGQMEGFTNANPRARFR